MPAPLSPPLRSFHSIWSLQLLTFLVNATLSTAQSPNPDLVWPTPKPIVYGTPLSKAQLQASHAGGVPGRFDYSPGIGTVLYAGSHTLSVTFAPDDGAQQPATATVTLQVNKAPLTIRPDDKTAFFIDDSGAADIVEFITVGDPGNPAQTIGNDAIGAVSHTFDIGKYEITNAIYTDFLNAVGKNDPITAGQFDPHPPLFNILMETEARGGIMRHGAAPNFSYETKPNMGNKPVNFVSFWDACRFCNWLHNGMPEGPQDTSTTEDGAYDLTDVGAMMNNTTRRKPGARYFIPTESEWHKTAFYDPDKGGYWAYATQSDSEPDAALADSLGDIINATDNVANYGRNADWDSNGNGSIDDAILGGHLGPEDGNVTSVGSGGAGNQSYYGAADIGGNVSEWTESPLANWARMTRGGNWNGPSQFLAPNYRFPARFPFELQDFGFRIARPADGRTQLPALSASYFGFVNGDKPIHLDSPVKLLSQATPMSPVGTYAIIASGASSSNYEISYVEGTLFLNEKQNPTINWPTPEIIVYGTPLSSGQLNASAGFGSNVVPGSLTYTPPLGTILDVGSHELIVKFQPTDGDVYNPITQKVPLEVLPAPLVIRADDKGRMTGSPNPTFTATYQGFTNGDTIDSLWIPVRLTTTATPESPPGAYPIVARDAFSPNYAITFQAGTLTVVGDGRILPEIVWNPASLVYGAQLGSAQLNAQEINGVPGTFAYDPPLGTVLNAGSGIPLLATFLPDDPSVYETGSASATINVAKAPLTIRVHNRVRAAGTANPTLTASFEGFVGSDSISDLDLPLLLTTTATIASPVGEYPITGSIGPDNNYTFTLVEGTLRVSDKLIPEFLWDSPGNITYGQALTAAQLNATVSGDVAGSWSYDPPLGRVLHVGTHTLTASFTPTDTNTHESVTAMVEITVTPASLLIRAVDAERPVNTSNPALNVVYSGFVNGESEEDLDLPPRVITDAQIDSPAGAYPIRVENASDPDYTITTEDGTLTVFEKLVPAIEWQPAALTYGQPLSAAHLNASEENGIAGSFVYDPPAGTFLEAGEEIPLSVTFEPDDSTRFEPATASVMINVAKAPLTIRADDLSRAAGQENPMLTATYVGFVRTDAPGDLDSTLTLSTTAAVDSPPGDYPITGTIGSDNNYAITLVEGTLTVEDRLVPELNWTPPENITYGEVLTDAQLNATVADGIAGTLAYDPAPGTRLDAGDHLLRVTFTPESAVAYQEATASVELTVVPANLIIRATDVERPANTENPTLSVVYEGFVDGESEADLDSPPTIVTDAEIDSPPGTYVIRVENAAAANYTITLEEGTLTVTENLDLALLSAEREGDDLLLSWKESASLKLFVSRDMIVWEAAEATVQAMAEGVTRATYSLSQLISGGDLQLYFRLQKTE